MKRSVLGEQSQAAAKVRLPDPALEGITVQNKRARTARLLHSVYGMVEFTVKLSGLDSKTLEPQRSRRR